MDAAAREARAGSAGDGAQATARNPISDPGQAAPRRDAAVGARKPLLAANTRRLYASDWARFAAFCLATGASALPAGPETVAALLSEPGPGRAVRRRWLTAIDHRHHQHGLPLAGNAALVRAALKQARAAAPRQSRQPPPSPAALRSMAARCPRDLAGQRDRALLLLLAAGLSRSAVVGLQAEQLRLTEDGVRLGGPGAARVELPRGARHDLCPVRALEDWLQTSDTRFGPVFRKVTRWGTVEPHALGADAVRRILARRSC